MPLKKLLASPRMLIDTDFQRILRNPTKAREGYRLVLKEGTVRDYPLAIKNASGKVTDVSFNASVYKDSVGVVRGIFAVARDVTETKKAVAYARSLIGQPRSFGYHQSRRKDHGRERGNGQVTGVLREKLIGTDFLELFHRTAKGSRRVRTSI